MTNLIWKYINLPVDRNKIFKIDLLPGLCLLSKISLTEQFSYSMSSIQRLIFFFNFASFREKNVSLMKTTLKCNFQMKCSKFFLLIFIYQNKQKLAKIRKVSQQNEPLFWGEGEIQVFQKKYVLGGDRFLRIFVICLYIRCEKFFF